MVNQMAGYSARTPSLKDPIELASMVNQMAGYGLSRW